MGSSTVEAVKAFQVRAGLPADGRLTQDTVTKLNAELYDHFITTSKHRTEKLHSLLQRMDFKIDKQERSAHERRIDAPGD